ncbi:MAG: PQQ-binding-like beta-propeller repeat protein [Solirubrobacteraceae bacterium]|nr:PQQ-binding-like beta-propeller repeat protein [Solirubrobacteraceae bacterium]
MPSFLRKPKVLIAAGAAVLVLAGGAVAAYLVATKKPGDVINTGVEFTEPPPTETVPEPEPERPKRPRTVNWPRYGYTLQHTRNFQPRRPLNGPWRKAWVHQVGALTEFPPVIWKGRIFHLIDDGLLVAVRAANGRRIWKRHVGTLAASSPAVDDRSVYVVLLERAKGSGRGRVVALRQRDGRIRWSKDLPSRAESSPLVIGGRLYFGSEDGTVYALDKRTGREIWTYRANGAVKGSPTYSDGKLYFGNYGGDVQAIRASDGKLVWRNGAGVANFYATAAVAYGRVYIGNTDGRLYSFSARSGALAWARQTGGYVYSSAAVHTVPKVGPTVFVGSYDGRFYAFDARTGATRWTHDAGGKISGSPTVVGNTVYFANLAKRETVGLNTRTGRRVFHRSTGSFDPIVTDGEKLYLTGSSSLTALRQVSERHR